ncbi:MAG: GNAT family N-acetyltransferase [Gammaproteobacteria bacterium]|nr:GNAT family N-acetyltransferase [Gammaproteobacteria bacterium]
MEFVCYPAWEQLPPSAERLLQRAARDTLFLSKPWFENLIANGLEEGRRLLLACVLDAEELLALLPLSVGEGGHYHSLTHLYTSLYGPLLAERLQTEALACLARGLRQLPVRFLQLDPVADDDPNLQRLQQAMVQAGFSCQRHFRFYNWYHRVDGGSFTDYMAARPGRVRNTIARKRRKLEREQGCRIHLFGDRDLQQGLAEFAAVHSASWKADEQFEPFVRGLAGKLSRQGWLRLAVLYAGERPAAAQFWFVAHGTASIFKLSYDQAWRRYSPGSILIAHLMERVIDHDGVEEIDFLTGNDAYKQDWMSQRRERCRLCFFVEAPAASKGAGFATTVVGLLKWLWHKRYNPALVKQADG